MEVKTNFNIAEKLLKEMHCSGIQGNRLKLKTQETRAEDDRKFPVIQEPAWAESAGNWSTDYLLRLHVHPGSPTKDHHYLFWMWSPFQGEPRDASAVCFCRVQLLGKCRPGRSDQQIKPPRAPSASFLEARNLLRELTLRFNPRRTWWQAKVERILVPMCPFLSLTSTAAVY
jgi:hypothetical protein